jgi:hypothetical protein
MNTRDKTFDDLVGRIQRMKASGTVDLSSDEDLSLAVMNLVSLEEHFYFTAMRTGSDHYLDLLDEVREVRKETLGRLIDRHEGETWCACKHLLAASMRLMEVGVKLRAADQAEAKRMFERAWRMYALFWGLRLKLIDTADLPKVAAEEKPWTVQDIVAKLVNCCDE